MPDRYANGDPSNDRGGLTGPRSVTGYDPADPGWYHGGDLKGLTGTCTDTRTGLARVKDLGFTAIWVTPVVAQQYVQADSAAYHGYWGLDFTRVDPHLGHERRLRRVRRLRAPPRAEGLPRRRRQPHGRRHHPGGRLELPRRRRGAVPRLQGQAVLGAALRGHEALPVPLEPLPAAPAARPPAEPEPEEAGVAEPGDAVPQPREHHVRQLLARVLRAGRLLRARRHLHGAAVRRERARRRCSATGSGSSRWTASASTRRSTSTARSSERWAPKILAAARAAGVTRLRDLRRGLPHRHRRALVVRPRPRDPERHRLPAPGQRSSATRAARRDRAASRRGSPTTTTSAGRPASLRRLRPSSGTTTSAEPRRRSASRRRPRARSSSRA